MIQEDKKFVPAKAVQAYSIRDALDEYDKLGDLLGSILCWVEYKPKRTERYYWLFRGCDLLEIQRSRLEFCSLSEFQFHAIKSARLALCAYRSAIRPPGLVSARRAPNLDTVASKIAVAVEELKRAFPPAKFCRCGTVVDDGWCGECDADISPPKRE